MADNSEISWTTHTANLWWGCAKVHAGCDHCYAETLSHRWGNAVWGPKAPRRAIKAVWNDLARYQREAAAANRVDRVFVGSMMDIFEKPFPLIDAQGNSLEGDTDQLRQRFFAEVVPNSPNLLFLLLTKRPGNILKYIPEAWTQTPPTNVMYGTSVVDQETADDMIPLLLKVPGRRFLSMEPLLGPVEFKGKHTCDGETDNWNYLTGWESTWRSQVKPGYSHSLGADYTSTGIHWVIVGGESGHGARPMHIDWVRSLRDQCAEAGVPFHFKQWGEWAHIAQTPRSEVPFTDELNKPFHQWHDGAGSWRLGKSYTSHLLDGQVHHAVPTK